jgi:hypothetical protein
MQKSQKSAAARWRTRGLGKGERAQLVRIQPAERVDGGEEAS